MTVIMKTLEEKYNYPVDIEYAVNFDRGGKYRVNLLQCRPLQTKGRGHSGAGARPNVKEKLFSIKGSFMGGNVCIGIKYIVFISVSEYLALSEQNKYLVARTVGKLNTLLRGKSASLIGPGRWGTTTPSLGVPVNFMEISNFVSISEVAYNEKGLRPELSYGSHFFQDLVEAGTLYTAIYRGEDGVFFDDGLLATMPNVFSQLVKNSGLESVISVYDVSGRESVLYSEIESQECFLGFSK